MSDRSAILPQEIKDDDIRGAARLLGLREDAFHGPDGSDARHSLLKSMGTIDVAACPGSGKTTLLVAKLAILAENWRHRTRGICVLSHTNVARRELEARLGNTPVGRALLSYPHFIGTIHAFVNEFLALPWLRGLGIPIKIIDSEICQERRWRKIPPAYRSALEKKQIDASGFRIADTSFRPVKKKGQFPFGTNTATFKSVQKACEDCAKEGYHCHEDMFVWGNALLDNNPSTVGVIRDRFPMLFLDEAQDNSEAQSAILHRVFMADGAPVLRQRFGDANQAIFNFAGQEGATTDPFPNHESKRDLPNSHRFGRRIAHIADPLGLCPCGLAGQGPKQPLASGTTEAPHTIFLFDDDGVGAVLGAYADLLIGTFSAQELHEGSFIAIGQIHKDKGDDHSPRHVGRYWSEYDPELSKADPTPRSFVQYIFAGQASAGAAGEALPAAEKIAQGLLRLAGMARASAGVRPRRHSHRYAQQMVESSASARGWYRVLLSRFAVRRTVLNRMAWNRRWRAVVRAIGEAIAGGPLTNSDVNAFLDWPAEPDAPPAPATIVRTQDNVYRYCRDGTHVAIRLGSIHSVKGETHTATLVLETFWFDHNLESIKQWLLGDLSGAGGNGIRVQNRLKIHYVAMTRPTHLICLAMKRSTFTRDGGILDDDAIAKLIERGWIIKQVGQSGSLSG